MDDQNSRKRKVISLTETEFNKLRRVQFHQELTPDQVTRAKAIWKIIGGFDHSPSYEVFELDMCLDHFVDQELTVIEWVAEQFAKYRKANPGAGTFHLRRQLGKIYADSVRQFPPTIGMLEGRSDD